MTLYHQCLNLFFSVPGQDISGLEEVKRRLAEVNDVFEEEMEAEAEQGMNKLGMHHKVNTVQ